MSATVPSDPGRGRAFVVVSLRAVAAVIAVRLVAGIAAAIAVRASADGGDPVDVARSWVDAALDGDCGRWMAPMAEDTRRLVEAAGGCPLSGPVEGRVGAARVVERHAGGAVIVEVEVEGGPLGDEPQFIVLSRSSRSGDGPWLVQLSSQACATPDGQAPGPGDCEPPTFDG